VVGLSIAPRIVVTLEFHTRLASPRFAG
jgi:hypothetical protein